MESNNRDTVTVISDPDGLTFATAKKWTRLMKEDLDTLNGYEVIGNMIGVCSVYILLRNRAPLRLEPPQEDFVLLQTTTNEETGKIDFFIMDLNRTEAECIKNYDLTFWEN